MFDQVIAGVDGKPNGRDAARLASKLVAQGGRLTLVNVYVDDHVFRDGSGFVEIVRQDSLALLGTELAALGVDAEIATVGANSIGAGLHHIAEERDADLLVVGSCSRGLAGRLMLGDDMRASLEGAPCAVAIAPRGFAEHAAPFSTIGVAYDRSPESEAALSLARELASEHECKITARTVINIPTYAFNATAAVNWGGVMEDMVKESQKRLDSLGDVQGHAVQGITTEELEKFAETVDLLVVGARGYGPVRRLLFGSTSEYLARTTRCPLLVLARGLTGHGEPSLATAGISQADE
jgi:nucleotide-binding universal stress UspA family protein